jgi:hypothetical protein
MALVAPVPHPRPIELTDYRVWTDGGCTVFPNGIGPYIWQNCCVVHDLGGSDEELLTCIREQMPDWSLPLLLVALAAMKLGRPVYSWLYLRGWWPGAKEKAGREPGLSPEGAPSVSR